MYFKLSASQENDLLNRPETGMGYQVVEASKAGSYTREKFLVLNSEVVIEMDTSTNDNVRKVINDSPVERYALPYNDEIKFAFHVQPKKTDTLQRGTVQPANGKRGGGEEAYFAKGTAAGTFIKQTSY